MTIAADVLLLASSTEGECAFESRFEVRRLEEQDEVVAVRSAWLAVEVEREVGRAHGLVEVDKKRFTETDGQDFIAGTNQFLGYDGIKSETLLIDPGRWKRTVLFEAGSLDSRHATATSSGRIVGRGRVGSGTIWDTRSGERITYAGGWTWAESTLDGKRLMTLDSRGTMTLHKMP